MNRIIGFIPHLFTLGNLLCGCLAIVLAAEWALAWAGYLIGIAVILDFFDGFLARLLKVSGELGKQLDSLADVVSFGVAPGFIMYQYLKFTVSQTQDIFIFPLDQWYIFLAFLIPLFSAFRLAKFNIDARQTDRFLGLPTPANAIFFCSIPVILNFYSLNEDVFFNKYINQVHVEENGIWKSGNNKLTVTNNVQRKLEESGIHWSTDSRYCGPLYKTAFIDTKKAILDLEYYSPNNYYSSLLLNTNFIICLIISFSLLLVSNLPLFALKFKNFGWADNKIRYIFVLISMALLIFLNVVAIPFIILLYIVLSVLNNYIFKL